jgi:hypothetical protein
MITTPKNRPLVLNDAEKRACAEEIGRCEPRPSGIRVFTCSSLATRGGIDFCPDLGGRGLTVNPKGELIFCCDTLGEGAVLGSLEESSLSELFGRAYLLSRRLKAIRRRILKDGIIPEGFDTCDFCNHVFARIIRYPDAPGRV